MTSACEIEKFACGALFNSSRPFQEYKGTSTHRPVFKTDIIRLEVHTAKQRLQGRAVRPRADERRVERGCDEQDGRLCVIHAGLHEDVVPDDCQVPG